MILLTGRSIFSVDRGGVSLLLTKDSRENRSNRIRHCWLTSCWTRNEVYEFVTANESFNLRLVSIHHVSIHHCNQRQTECFFVSTVCSSAARLLHTPTIDRESRTIFRSKRRHRTRSCLLSSLDRFEGPRLIDATTVVFQQMIAAIVNHQNPDTIFDKHGNLSVNHVPANEIEVGFSFGSFNLPVQSIGSISPSNTDTTPHPREVFPRGIWGN